MPRRIKRHHKTSEHGEKMRVALKKVYREMPYASKSEKMTIANQIAKGSGLHLPRRH